MDVKSLALCVWEWRRYTIQYNVCDIRVCDSKALLCWEHLCRRGIALSLLQAQSCSNHHTWKQEVMLCVIIIHFLTEEGGRCFVFFCFINSPTFHGMNFLGITHTVAAHYGRRCERATERTPSPLVQRASNNRDSPLDQVHSMAACAPTRLLLLVRQHILEVLTDWACGAIPRHIMNHLWPRTNTFLTKI